MSSPKQKEILSHSSKSIYESICEVLIIPTFNKMVRMQKVTFSKDKIQIGQKIININVERGTKVILSLHEVLVLVLSGCIIPYPYNRGQASINRRTIKSIIDEYNPTAIGEMTICWESSSNKFIMCDWHHRLLGYLKRIISGKNKSIELFDSVSISVAIPDTVVETYKRVNTAKSHGSSENASNPDLASGKAMMDIMKEIPDYQLEYFKKNYSGTYLQRALKNNVYVIIVEGTDKTKQMDFADISSMRSLSQKFAVEIATQQNAISKSQIKTIVDGIDDYYKIMTNEKLNITDKTLDTAIRKSQYILGIVVHQKFNPNQFTNFGWNYDLPIGFSNNPKMEIRRIARSLTVNAKDISESLNSLGRGSVDSQRKFLRKFVTYLTK